MTNCRIFVALLTVLLLQRISVLPGLAQSPASTAAAAPQLVIIDTDIGDDIDDAFALALALKSPELRILGVTTAFGDTELRARLVDRYLAAVGRKDIPVAVGVATPHTNVFTQAAYARRQPDRKHPDGVAFLLEQIRAHPGQITVIAIGPEGNLAAAIQRDPATFRKLKRVVAMKAIVLIEIFVSRNYAITVMAIAHRQRNRPLHCRMITKMFIRFV